MSDNTSTSSLILFQRKTEDYIKLKKFLYDNPKYIHQDFNNNEININTNLFVKFNIEEICMDVNIRDRFIIYYGNKYYEKIYNENNSELNWILSNLQLLINK